MEQYLILRDGVELSRHHSYPETMAQLHRIQGQSVEWACQYEGYEIVAICSKCSGKSDPLAIFPRGICLACYEREHDQDTPAQDYATIMQVFGGK
jgi:hypothetical protein